MAKKTQLDGDVEFVLGMAKKHVQMDTIATLFLNEFHDSHTRCYCGYKKLRARFRRALNECHKRGHCGKWRIGTTIYQTGDVFGGKSCISYDFTGYIKREIKK